MNLGVCLKITWVASGGGATSETPLETMQRLAAGETAIIDLTAATDVETLADLSGLGNTWGQTTASNKPTIDASTPTLGLLFDGSNDYIFFASAGSTFGLMGAVTLTDTDTRQRWAQAPAVLEMQSGSGTALGGTVEVNGVAAANEGAFFTAAVTNSEQIIHGKNLSSGAANLVVGATGHSMNGRLRRMVVVDETALGADLAEFEAAALLWLAAS